MHKIEIGLAAANAVVGTITGFAAGAITAPLEAAFEGTSAVLQGTVSMPRWALLQQQ